MNLVFKLKEEVDQLKEAVELFKTQTVEKICAQVLDGFNDRLTRVEGQIRGLEVALGIVAEPKGEAGN